MKSDVQLKQEVLTRLELEPKIDPASLTVSVDNGVVTLKGRMEKATDRITTEKAVRRIKGVRGFVGDELQVETTNPMRPRDAELAQAVNDAIQWLTTVPRESIRVSILDLWVTLEGEVEAPHQSEFVEEVVRGVPGVRGVRNFLTVAKEKKAA